MKAIYPNLKGDAKLAVEHAFPELRESEDERIRKELIEAFEAYDVESSWNLIPVKHILAWLEKQKEQKPNIELIQRSWYMEGYHDREFGKEPKWITKTGEGGPKHELNPRYGQPLTEEPKPVEKQDYSGLNDLERAIHRGFLCAGVENVPVTIIKETAQECLARMKPAEWSEEDEKSFNNVLDGLRYAYEDLLNNKSFDSAADIKDAFEWMCSRFKCLIPQNDLEELI